MLSSCSEGYLVPAGVFYDSGINTHQSYTGSWEYIAPKGNGTHLGLGSRAWQTYILDHILDS